MRVIIVDDEPLARALLREYLAAHADIELVAECANGFDAVKAIAEHQPELVFLDIQMPKLKALSLNRVGGVDPKGVKQELAGLCGSRSLVKKSKPSQVHGQILRGDAFELAEPALYAAMQSIDVLDVVRA